MSEPKFTSGPISITKLTTPGEDWTGTRFILRAKDAPGGTAAIMGGLGKEEEKANAELYAAAPDMYVALGQLIDDEPCEYDHHGNCQTHNLGNPCGVAMAIKALAKARGEVK
jgi:hypothetical protein